MVIINKIVWSSQFQGYSELVKKIQKSLCVPINACFIGRIVTKQDPSKTCPDRSSLVLTASFPHWNSQKILGSYWCSITSVVKIVIVYKQVAVRQHLCCAKVKQEARVVCPNNSALTAFTIRLWSAWRIIWTCCFYSIACSILPQTVRMYVLIK